MKIENKNIVLQVNLNGGSYFDFHFKDMLVNPINWRNEDPDNPPFMGHFLCFDRWGPPTEAEKKNGFPHHGEANIVDWELLSEPQKKNGLIESSMKCWLPMGGLQLKRDIKLSEEDPVFFVKEEIKNQNKYGRMFNMVQHVTIAPPFLDNCTLFDNNTEKGFENKEDGTLDQEYPVLKWPEINYKEKKFSLRQFQNDWPRVSSFVLNSNDQYGWATACNPQKGFMLGYVWKREDYPWINFWRSMEKGLPKAFGMEFGTTGLHEPFPVVAKKGKIFGQNIYDFIDADEVIEKTFMAFLAKIPEDYNGVEKIEVNGPLLTIKEKDKVSGNIEYSVKDQLQ